MVTNGTPDNTKQKQPDTEPGFTFREFLENVPPGRNVRLDDGSFRTHWVGGDSRRLIGALPEISLYCGDSVCQRAQNFAIINASTGFFGDKHGDVAINPPAQDVFVRYYCRNCGRTWKTYALRLTTDVKPDPQKVFGCKFGEVPQFGPPLPAKLLQLAGENGDLLKKGRQSENQSLGIGAFAYYRRVVEFQKSRLIDELKNAIERLGGNPTALAALEAARDENQFTKALEIIANVMPKELFVSGQNPLKLLHGPLSVGLHGMTDEQCLSKAHSIRIVLVALLERIQMVTEEKAELYAAIKDLLPPPPEKGVS